MPHKPEQARVSNFSAAKLEFKSRAEGQMAAYGTKEKLAGRAKTKHRREETKAMTRNS